MSRTKASGRGRRVPVGELPDERALAALVDARLVVRVDTTAEVAHEVVFRAWPLLAAWLEEARADLVLERDLRASARVWDMDGRVDDNLYRGTRLQAALEWSDRRTEQVPDVMAEFLAAGRQLAGTTRDRDPRTTPQGTSRAPSRDVGAGRGGDPARARARRRAAALISRNNAEDAAEVAEERRREAAHQALVSSSVALRSSSRDLAALLAVEAHRIAPAQRHRDGLFGLLTAFPGIGATITARGWAAREQRRIHAPRR